MMKTLDEKVKALMDFIGTDCAEDMEAIERALKEQDRDTRHACAEQHRERLETVRDADELKALKTRLKSGEYDGTDIMAAWIIVDEMIKANALLQNIHDELMYGDVYQWDNGQEFWQQMRDYCS